jgi:YidC/Oxa1 family membrane protein insertase
MLLAMLLVGVLLFGWDSAIRYFYPNANKPKPEASATPTAAATAKPTREGGLGDAADKMVEAADLKTQLARPRVAIAAPGLVGSINLAGGLVDDLSLPASRRPSRRTATTFASIRPPVRLPSISPSLAGPMRLLVLPCPMATRCGPRPPARS